VACFKVWFGVSVARLKELNANSSKFKPLVSSIRRNICGEKRNVYKVLTGNVKRRDHLGDLGIDEDIILKCIRKTYDWKMWTGFIRRLQT
jgi:hypothetical protein